MVGIDCSTLEVRDSLSEVECWYAQVLPAKGEEVGLGAGREGSALLADRPLPICLITCKPLNLGVDILICQEDERLLPLGTFKCHETQTCCLAHKISIAVLFISPSLTEKQTETQSESRLSSTTRGHDQTLNF